MLTKEVEQWANRIVCFGNEWRDGGLSASMNVSMADYIRSRCNDENLEAPTDEEIENLRRNMAIGG